MVPIRKDHIMMEIHSVSIITKQYDMYIPEYQAILGKGAPSFHDCTLYVTKHPCHGCAQVIIQSGISNS